jgi:flagellar motility protein MotE (MotC chaperone)
MARLSRISLAQAAEEHGDQFDEDVLAFLDDAEANCATDRSPGHYNDLLRELVIEGATKMRTLFATMYADYRNIVQEQATREEELRELNTELEDIKTLHENTKQKVLVLERSNRLLNEELNKSETEVNRLQKIRSVSAMTATSSAIKPKDFKGTNVSNPDDRSMTKEVTTAK